MKSIFSPEGPLFRFTERAINLVVLNILYLIFCIPVVTIGPATTALRYVTLKYAANEEDRVWAPFIYSFKQNLKQGMIVGVISTVVGTALAWALWFNYYNLRNGDAVNMMMLALTSLSCVIFLMMMGYIYPMLARYDNSLKQMVRTAVILAIRHLPATVCMAVIAAAPIVLLMYTPTTFMLAMTFYCLIGFALVAFLQDKFITRIFWQYSPREHTEE